MVTGFFLLYCFHHCSFPFVQDPRLAHSQTSLYYYPLRYSLARDCVASFTTGLRLIDDGWREERQSTKAARSRMHQGWVSSDRWSVVDAFEDGQMQKEKV